MRCWDNWQKLSQDHGLVESILSMLSCPEFDHCTEAIKSRSLFCQGRGRRGCREREREGEHKCGKHINY